MVRHTLRRMSLCLVAAVVAVAAVFSALPGGASCCHDKHFNSDHLGG